MFSLFLYPLYRSRCLSAPLYWFAKRTLWTALVALVTSAANVTVLTILHTQGLGWVYLTPCTVDVTIKALVLFFVTSPYGGTQPQRPIDTVTAPVIRRLPTIPILQTSSLHQPGIFSPPFISMPEALINNEMEYRGTSSSCPSCHGHWTSAGFKCLKCILSGPAKHSWFTSRRGSAVRSAVTFSIFSTILGYSEHRWKWDCSEG